MSFRNVKPTTSSITSGHRIGAAVLVAALAISTSTAFGQSAARRANVQRFYQPVPSWPVEMGLSYHHASTYAEGVQRGRAQMIQAEANYLFNASQAAITYEQAQSLALENKQQRIEYLRSLRASCEQERQDRIAELRSQNLAKRQLREQEALRLASGEIEQPSQTDLNRK